MPVLPNYQAFGGRHWETGSIANALAYQGVKAPHTGKSISEALLVGISGGITVGYFLFQYKGYDPHLALMTRNTFDPMTTIFDRLAIPQEVLQTDNVQKGEANLIDVLESGCPAVVWADAFMLPYNNIPSSKESWAMFPLVVYGSDQGTVHVADRSAKPLHVEAEVFKAARARVKQDKFRVMSLQPPDFNRLASAVQKGIWQCVSLYTENPPKGAKDNWGMAALQKWAEMFTNTRNKQSWTRYFPRGAGLYSGLVGHPGQPGAFQWICTWGAAGGGNGGAERALYADFLDEAAIILNKPDLREVGTCFRESSAAWLEFAHALLPDEVPLLSEVRSLIFKRHNLFVEQGDAKLDEIRDVDTRLREIQAVIKSDFPMTDSEVGDLLADLSEHVRKIHDIERDAINDLQKVIA